MSAATARLPRRPRLVIFDMDDTLVATAALWKRAEVQLWELCGGQWTPELALRYKGMNALDVAATIQVLSGTSMRPDECQSAMREFLDASFREGPVLSMPGAVPCVRSLALDFRLVVASGSPAHLIAFALGELGIRECFENLVTSEDVARGKPHPDVFLHAAVQAEVAPEDCLVIEDSFIGVQAARAAGMRSFAVPSSRHEEVRALADYSDGELSALPSLLGISTG